MGAPPPGTTANPQGELVKMLGTFALMGVVFYVILIRPQRRRDRGTGIIRRRWAR